MIKNKQNTKAFVKTVAHEIGHVSKLLAFASHKTKAYKSQLRLRRETFRLCNTFSDDNKYRITDITDNLMLNETRFLQASEAKADVELTFL